MKTLLLSLLLLSGYVPAGAGTNEVGDVARFILDVTNAPTKLFTVVNVKPEGVIYQKDLGSWLWLTQLTIASNKVATINGVDMREFLKLARELTPEPHNAYPLAGISTLEIKPVKSEAQILRERADALEHREENI